jgi:hypothetical protein
MLFGYCDCGRTLTYWVPPDDDLLSSSRDDPSISNLFLTKSSTQLSIALFLLWLSY